MASIRDIKNRIKSTNSTKQITKAMNLVSTAKLKRARDRVEGVRPYFSLLRDVVSEILESSGGIQNPYFETREPKNTLVVVVTADRGQCGGYNTNSIKKALSIETQNQISVITLGTKAKDYFRKRNFDIKASFIHISESVNMKNTKQVANKAMELFKNKEVDEVYLVYNRFISTIAFEPTAIKLLPMTAPTREGLRVVKAEPLYEPSPEAALDTLIPQYITGTLYGALLEASASEQSSRMNAMGNATDNATKMIDDLTLFFNRARQASITSEISEIVSGAEAQK